METVIENFPSFSSSVQYTVAIVCGFYARKKNKTMHITFSILEQTDKLRRKG